MRIGTAIWMELGLSCVAALATVVFMVAEPPYQALSRTDLHDIKGGVKLTEEGGCGSCETHECEEIECSDCTIDVGPPTQTGKCRGQSGNSAPAKTCYSPSTAGDCSGELVSTDCVTDAWEGETCSGSADHPDLPHDGRDCG